MVLWRGVTSLVGVKSLLEEEPDIKCLRQYSLHLLKENHKLSRKLKVIISSLGNQDYTVTLLQNNVSQMNSTQSRLSELLGELAGVAIDAVARSQQIIRDIARCYNFEDLDVHLRRDITELENILQFVPLEDVRHAKDRCLRFLQSLQERGIIRDHLNRTENDHMPREYFMSSRMKRNAKLNQPKKGRKRPHPETNNFPASPSARRRLSTPFQNGRPESKNGRRNYKRSRMSVSETEDEQLKKSLHRRGQKRRAERNELVSEPEVGEQSPDGNASCDSDVSSAPDSELLISNDELAKMKSAVVELVDVLNDPAFEDDVYVARLKQSPYNKDSDENEYEIVDDVDASDEDEEKHSDSCNESKSDHEEEEEEDDDNDDKDQSKESSSQANEDNNSDSEDNLDEGNHADEDNHAEEDNHADDEAASGVSSVEGVDDDDDNDNDDNDNDNDDNDNEEEEEEEENTINDKENSSPNGKRKIGPRTPSPPPYEPIRRGPHTPPGLAPDSEGVQLK